MTTLLREKLEAHLNGWQHDLAVPWPQVLGTVSLDWEAVLPSARFEGADRIIPLRKNHGDTEAPRDSHVLRAFDNLAPSDVRAVLLGQDPYPKFERATGRSFEPGDLEQWTDDTPRSLERVLPVLARHRRPHANAPALGDWNAWQQALQDDPSWVGTPPDLFARWHREGVLCLNIGLTLSRFDKKTAPVKHQPMHMALWTPLVHAVLRALNARNKPMVLMLWGGKAQDAVSAANLPDKPGLVFRVDRPHPSATPDNGDSPPFFVKPNPFTAANDWLTAHHHAPIDW